MLEITLDKKPPSYLPGDVVTGRVQARPPDEMTCRDLEVTLGWSTSGQGNRDQEEVDSTSVFSGRWIGGRCYDYSFSLTLPEDGPASFCAQTMELSWQVSARIATVIDSGERATADLQLRPAPDAVPVIRSLDHESHFTAGQLTKMVLKVLALLAVLSGGGWAVQLFWRNGDTIPAIIGGVIALAASLFCWVILADSLSLRKLRGVTVSVPEVALGDGELTCTVSHQGSEQLQVEKVTAELEIKEITSTGSSGTGSSNRRDHELARHKEEVELEAGADPRTFRGALAAPQLPCSFESNHNKIRWWLVVTIALPRGPDWIEFLDLTCEHRVPEEKEAGLD